MHTSSQTFKYDELSRLKQAVGSYGTKNYSYDPIGNILSKDGINYTYGAKPHAVSSLSDGTTLTYDANGNMKTKMKGAVTFEYFYDTENRLKEVKKNGLLQAKFEYDGDGGRTKKTSFSGGGTTKYVGELYEVNGTTVTKSIFLGGTRIATQTGSQTLFFHPNHLGSTNLLSDKTGVLKELLEYEPFGSFSRREKFGTGEEVAKFYFTGKLLDDETGLFYFGARYYDPGLGKFITTDPTIQRFNDPQDFNRYSYSRNNPINYTDPSGLGFKKWFKKFFSHNAGIIAIFKGIPGLIAGSVYTENWEPTKNIAIGTTTAFVLSFGNPIATVSGFLTSSTSNTDLGKNFINWTINEVFDDGFGMQPRAAYLIGNIVAHSFINSFYYATLASLNGSYTGLEYRNSINQNEMSQYLISGAHQPGGSSTNFIANHGGKSQWHAQGRVASDIAFNETPVIRKIFKALKVRHSAAVVNINGKLFDSAEVALFAPLKGGFYGSPWTGISHQAFYRTLIEGGMSGAQALGAANQHAGWAFYLSSSIYGIEGHAAPLGIINAETNKER